MTERWDFIPSIAAEFPNDNPALHGGASWLCLTLTGPPRPVARPRPAAAVLPAPRTAPPPLVPAPAPATTPVAAAPEAELDEPSPESLRGIHVPLHPDVDWALEQLLSLQDQADAEPAAAAKPADVTDDAPVAEPVIVSPLALDPTPTPSSPALPEVDVVVQTHSDTVELATFPEDAESGFAITAPDGPASSRPGDVAFDVDGSPPAAPASPEADLAPELSSPPPEPDLYDAFVGALVDVALGAGATRAAAALPPLLDTASALDALHDELRDGLSRAKMLDGASARTSAFVSTALAWRAVLRGETDDLSACGTTTLDAWGVDVLKALGVGQDGRVDVRRELRRRGVAAFGMLAA